MGTSSPLKWPLNGQAVGCLAVPSLHAGSGPVRSAARQEVVVSGAHTPYVAARSVELATNSTQWLMIMSAVADRPLDQGSSSSRRRLDDELVRVGDEAAWGAVGI